MNSSRPTIGFVDAAHHVSGPSRYVTSILDGIDFEEFRVVVFGHPEGPHAGRAGVEVVDFRPYDPRPVRPPASAPAGSATATATATAAGPGRSGLKPLLKRALPYPARLWAGFGRDVRRMARGLKACPVDLIHINDTGCEPPPVAARLAGIRRVVGTFHVDPSYDLDGIRSGLPHRTLEYISNHCLSKGIGVSRDTGEQWKRRTNLPDSRVVTIYNGIDTDQFRPRLPAAEARRLLGLPDDPGLVWLGTIGRLDRAKGQADLIAAVSLLASDFPALRLMVAGTGPLRGELEAQAARLGVADRIHWLGFRNDIPLILDAVDVFAFPSVCEALGYALLEAMATEKPCVASAVGGIPEVIADGETGFVTPPRDPSALAGAIRGLLESPELRHRFGLAGRRRVLDVFNLKTMQTKTIGLYRTLLASPSPTPVPLAVQRPVGSHHQCSS